MRKRTINSAAAISERMTKVRESSTQEDGEITELMRRLEEAEETLRAIREGEVDALVVDGPLAGMGVANHPASIQPRCLSR